MYRVAILGAGIGAQHLEGFQALPADYEVAMICDVDEARATSLAQRIAGCRVSTDTHAAIDDPSIDIIDICLPPHLHGPIAKQALGAGKHVICEKPMAGSVLEADEMMAAAKAAGRELMPIFQYRYGRGLQQLAALMAAGLTGKPYVATLETHWDRRQDYYDVAWRGTWARERGGAILGHAIHIHDLVTRFFGPVTRVSAMLDTRVNPIETEDCAALAFTTESGGLVTSSVTLGAAGDTSRLRLVFERLTVESGRDPYAPGAGDWIFTARDTHEQTAIDDVLAECEDEPRAYAGQFAAFAGALSGADIDPVSAADGVRSIELVAAVYLSAREGRGVTLPLDRSNAICADWVPT